MARPRKNLPPDGLATIRALASHGAKETEIAKALGMDRKTWARIRDEDPDVRAAWSDARAIEHDHLVDSLFRQAVGAPAEYDADGNCVRAEQKPSPAPAMFLLKTRHGYREQGPDDGGTESRVSIQINLPAPLQADQYQRLIEIHPSHARPAASEAA